MSLPVAIVGLGVAGQIHARTLAATLGAKLVAAADLDEKRRAETARAHGCRVYSHWRELLAAEKGLAALILCTTTQERKGPLLACAERKLAVFCEKPPAHDLETARTIAEELAESGTLNAAGFQYRAHPLAERIKELVAGRRILAAQSLLARPMFQLVAEGKAPKAFYSKAACGGPVVEQGSHFVDLLRWVTGDEPLTALGAGDLGDTHPREGRDCEETSVAVLRHASGMLSTHIVNWSHAKTILQVRLLGADWELTWDVAKPSRLHGHVDGKPVDEQADAEPFEIELRAFLDAVRDGAAAATKIRCTYADACRTLAACVAAAEAIERGTTVPVPDILA